MGRRVLMALVMVIAVLALAGAGCGGTDDMGLAGPVVSQGGTTTTPAPSPDGDPAAFRQQADAICNETLMRGFMLRAESSGGVFATEVIDLFWNDQERQLPYWDEALGRMEALAAPAELAAAWGDYTAAGRELAAMLRAGLERVRAGADATAEFQQVLLPMIGLIRRAQGRAMEAGLVECFKLYYGGRLSGGEPEPDTTPDDG